MKTQITHRGDQFTLFPGTRYMGSKHKIIHEIWSQIQCLEFDSFYDAFGGSNVVGYFMKCEGKRVITNDFLAFSHIHSKAIIENSSVTIDENDVKRLLSENDNNGFIQETFNGIFYTQKDNKSLDKIRFNISLLGDQYKEAIALSALIRACVKKRSRGIFTFVGERYNDGRLDMKKTIEQHFLESIDLINGAVFDSGRKCTSYNSRVEIIQPKADLIYLDPPYFSPKSDNDYLRRYHFIEGLVRNWQGVEIQEHTAVKKFASYKSPFARRDETYEALISIFKKYKDSIIVISYSSNSVPSKDELIEMLYQYKKKVYIHEMDYTYSFGNQKHKVGNVNNRVKEYLFIGI